jgi:glutaminyl-peptide cyclotransferase
VKAQRPLLPLLLVGAFLLVASACWSPAAPVSFDGQRAHAHVKAQCDFGPRPTGSQASDQTGDYILDELKEQGWTTEEQVFTYRDTPVRNLIGKAGKGSLLILGAHYDTRRRADRDRVDPSAPVLGANDGASGVAVLLELARCLEKDRLDHEVWLAFFDAEDNGDLDGWEWIVGSTHFAQQLDRTPQAVIIADMIGDKDQQIYKERNSDPALQDRLWAIAANLGYESFIPEYKWAMFDDHTPFLRKGIPAVDIIDFDYPSWHTRQDTLDKVSAGSLERVGRVLEVFVEGSHEVTSNKAKGHGALPVDSLLHCFDPTRGENL